MRNQWSEEYKQHHYEPGHWMPRSLQHKPSSENTLPETLNMKFQHQLSQPPATIRKQLRDVVNVENVPFVQNGSVGDNVGTAKNASAVVEHYYKLQTCMVSEDLQFGLKQGYRPGHPHRSNGSTTASSGSDE